MMMMMMMMVMMVMLLASSYNNLTFSFEVSMLSLIEPLCQGGANVERTQDGYIYTFDLTKYS